MAKYGHEFIAIAKEKINYLFEASVGGGIPILRPITSAWQPTGSTRYPVS